MSGTRLLNPSHLPAIWSNLETAMIFEAGWVCIATASEKNSHQPAKNEELPSVRHVPLRRNPLGRKATSIIRLFHQGAPKYTRIGFMDATRMRATAQTIYARYSLLLDLRHL